MCPVPGPFSPRFRRLLTGTVRMCVRRPALEAAIKKEVRLSPAAVSSWVWPGNRPRFRGAPRHLHGPIPHSGTGDASHACVPGAV